MYQLAVVIPVYGQFDIAVATVKSLAMHATVPTLAIVVDDYSPNRPLDMAARYEAAVAGSEVSLLYHEHTRNFGISGSWNWGLMQANELEIPYSVAGNSDILFTHQWWFELQTALDNGYDLVGPITNAPGDQKSQNVDRYFPGYRITDEPVYLNKVAEYVRENHQGVRIETSINGFFMMGRREVWLRHTSAKKEVFSPKLRMLGSEYHLQKRLHQLGQKTGIVPGSFIFHYRSLSRGLARKGAQNAGFYRPTR